MIYPNNIYGSSSRQLIYYLSLQLCVILSISLISPLTPKVLYQVNSQSFLSLAISKYLDEGVIVIKSFQRVQDDLSFMINDLDKNLEFTTKLRITTYHLLVLIYYLAVGVHTVHTFYILTTFSNYLKCLCIRCLNMSSSLSSLLFCFFSSLLSSFSIFFSSLFIC